MPREEDPETSQIGLMVPPGTMSGFGRNPDLSFGVDPTSLTGTVLSLITSQAAEEPPGFFDIMTWGELGICVRGRQETPFGGIAVSNADTHSSAIDQSPLA